jgi:UDP-hydrolysing UDP-N-acetyl-D-glucosamine 2-epimerase
MDKKKIGIVITARPSYARVKTVLQAIDAHEKLELELYLTSSTLLDRYGSVVQVIEADGFVAKEKIFNVLEGDSPAVMAKTTGLAIIELASAFERNKPDVVITIADRYETLATSIAASYQNIPLAHIQGGEVTGNIDEKVRHANTKLADIHFVASTDAQERVMKLGENPAYVFNTGCPSIDIAREICDKPNLDFDPQVKYGGVGERISWKNGYIVVMQHAVTNENRDVVKQIQNTLDVIEKLKLPTFWFWPNVDMGSDGISKRIRAHREKNKNTNIHFFKNMDPRDFLRLIKNALVLVGNSSVGIRESSYLGVPVVNIGSRQKGRLKGENVIDCDYSRQGIADAISIQLKHGNYGQQRIYGDGYAGEKIAKILSTYTLRSDKRINY